MGLTGFASAHWLLEPLAEVLADRFQVILPDHRGTGASPPGAGPYGVWDLAEDACRLMDRLEIRRFCVFGVSMGGMVAQHLALRAADRVAGLALLCTTSGGREFDGLYPQVAEQQVAALYRLPPEQHARVILEPPISPCLKPFYPEAYGYLLRHRRARLEDREEVIRQHRAMAEFLGQTFPLEALTVPTLVLAGARDPVFPPANSRLLAQKIRGARLEILPGTDHMFFLERSRDVGELLAAFFSTLSDPGP